MEPPAAARAVAGAAARAAAPPGTGGASSSSYDQTILADGPVAYWAMNKLTGTEPDLTGNNHTGTYHSGTTAAAALPNADQAADFNGSSQYVSVPSSAAFSIPTTGNLTWEAWIRPDVLQFPNDSNGYVDWMGKCQDYGPTCEWEARMYSTTNSENRCNRMSAYVFNPSAGLGSAADWQPVCGLIQAGRWYHIVGEYTTLMQPSDCQDAATYPGMIDIWVNGVRWSHSNHGQTGCMSQYDVKPAANNSPLNIGTMSMDALVPGRDRQGGDLQQAADGGAGHRALPRDDRHGADGDVRQHAAASEPPFTAAAVRRTRELLSYSRSTNWCTVCRLSSTSITVSALRVASMTAKPFLLAA